MKAGCCCAVVLTLTASDAAVVVERRPPAKHWVLRQYRKKIFSKETTARALASGSINSARNYPHERGRDAGGFARRVGSAFGQHASKGPLKGE